MTEHIYIHSSEKEIKSDILMNNTRSLNFTGVCFYSSRLLINSPTKLTVNIVILIKALTGTDFWVLNIKKFSSDDITEKLNNSGLLDQRKNSGDVTQG